MITNTTTKIIAALIATVAWFALILQLYLFYGSAVIAGKPAGRIMLEFFSYFTILTNILVAVTATVILLYNRPVTFFHRPSTQAGVTLYITVVGLVYNIILRSLWSPAGMAKLADELLHTITPLLFIGFWLFRLPKGGLKWSNIFYWLIYPAAYCLYIIIQGLWSGFYPYPFIDVNTIGYTGAMRSAGVLLLVFTGLGLLLVWTDHAMGKQRVQEGYKKSI